VNSALAREIHAASNRRTSPRRRSPAAIWSGLVSRVT